MRVYVSKYFVKAIKPYLKKHKSLLKEITDVLDNFEPSNSVSLGSNVYKIRLTSSDLNKGKSGSFRMIILMIEVDNVITPVSLFYKGDRENITKKEIQAHAKKIIKELKEG